MKRALVASVALFAQVSTASGQPESETEALARADKFADQVVRIIPMHKDGSPAPEGFGLIVGGRNDELYIATPYHVVHGMDHQSSLSSKLHVVFRDHPYTEFMAERLEGISERYDLAAVRVDRGKGFTPPDATSAAFSQLPRGTWVWNIGISQSWNMPGRAGRLGQLDDISGAVRVDKLRTPPGSSGGAGVTEFGIVGIVLEDAGQYSLLLPVDRVTELFKTWNLPVNLITPLPPAGYPGADPILLPAIIKPSDYCDSLKVIIQSAGNDFFAVSGKKLSDTTSRARVTLKDWHACYINHWKPAPEYFGCELGPFNFKVDAEKMLAEVSSDIQKSCLTSDWSLVESLKDEVLLALNSSVMFTNGGDGNKRVRVDPNHPLIELSIRKLDRYYRIDLDVDATESSFR